jgi:hypothetical protein
MRACSATTRLAKPALGDAISYPFQHLVLQPADSSCPNLDPLRKAPLRLEMAIGTVPLLAPRTASFFFL